jgi:uncharacterized protein YegJ (DUF2314 family)
MKKHLFTFVFLLMPLVCPTPATADDKPLEDRVVNVAGSDAEMNAAIAKARSLLPGFWEIFANPQHGETDFSIKVRIDDGKKHEHFWTRDIERKDGKIFATIDDDPEIVKNVKMDQRIEVPEANISDWLYMRDGKMYGNYTIRPLFKQMTPKEADFYKKLLAEP